MKVYVVDNGGQWTHREWRVLKYLGIETKIISNTVPIKTLIDERVDALVLSGGSPSISFEAYKLGNIGEYLDSDHFAILGICVGAQFIALHYHGSVGPADTPEYGKMSIEIIKAGKLLKDLGKKFYVWESHNDEVKKLPENFELLASSETCKVQAFEHSTKPIFAVQFHPEVENTQFGYEIFNNFLEIIK
jgi:GMP synthase (glutamine-hydrolysing)